MHRALNRVPNLGETYLTREEGEEEEKEKK
jgi:hypothetical protein